MAHGDIFPLPTALVDSLPRRSSVARWLYQRLRARHCLQRRLRSACTALNWCADARSGRFTLLEEWLLPSDQRLRVSGASSATPLQTDVLGRMHRRIRAFGARPSTTPQEALRELLHVSDLESEVQPNSLRAFRQSDLGDDTRLKILRPSWRCTPQEITLVAPPHVAQFFDDVSSFRRSQEELDELDGPALRPYVDPTLRHSRKIRIEFFKRLAKLGLVSFRTRVYFFAGLFFVEKKGGQIRMVLDARPTNVAHRLPPHTSLGTPAAWAELDLSAAEVGWHPPLWDEEPVDGGGAWMASGDLEDSFYQFTSQALGGDFAFDFPEDAGTYDCTRVWCEQRGDWVSVDSSVTVFPVFCGIGMGWSWALWAVHNLVEHKVEAARSDMQGSFVRDKCPPPVVRPGLPVVGVYVDNFAFAGASAEDASKAFRDIVDHFEASGIRLHELVEPSQELFVHVGLAFDPRRLRLRPKKERAWRLYLALHGCRLEGKLFGWQLRIVIGHLVNFFQLCPLALSVLSACYRFVGMHLHQRVTLWDEVVRELMVLSGLCFLVEVDLAAPPCSVATCSDACLSGYAFHCSDIGRDEALEAMAVKERWRFLCKEVVPSSGSAVTSWTPSRDHEHPLEHLFAVKDDLPDNPFVPYDAKRSFDMVEVDGVVAPLPDQLLVADRWRLVCRGAWNRQEAIHLLEARTSLMCLRWAARSRNNFGSKLLTIGDNLADITACEKGRAKDAQLRWILRQSLAYSLATEIRWKRRFAESERNPSDADSRRLLPPGCSVKGPGFRTKAEPGQHRARHPWWPRASREQLLARRGKAGPRLEVLSVFEGSLDYTLGKQGVRLRVPGPAVRDAATCGRVNQHAWRSSPRVPLARPKHVDQALLEQRRLDLPAGKCGPRAITACEKCCSPRQSFRKPRLSAYELSQRRQCVQSGRMGSRYGSACDKGVRSTICEKRVGTVRCSEVLDRLRLKREMLQQRVRDVKPRPGAVVLELFAGCARLSSACSELGLKVGVPFDINAGKQFDLSDPRVQATVLRWLRDGKVWYVHMGTPCTGFSIAATTCTSTTALELSLTCATFCLRVIRLCMRKGILWSLENPESSKLFKWIPFQRLAERPGVFRVLYHNCRYGTPWLKPTTLLTNCDALLCLGRLCRCTGVHLHLRGKVSCGGRQTWLTKLSGAYPPALCWSWAQLLVDRAPSSAGRGHAVLRSHWEDQLCRECKLSSSHYELPGCPSRFQLPFDRFGPRWGTSW